MNNTINGYRPIRNTKTSFGSYGPQMESVITTPRVAEEIVKNKGLVKLLAKIKESKLVFDFETRLHANSVAFRHHPIMIMFFDDEPYYVHKVLCKDPKYGVEALIYKKDSARIQYSYISDYSNYDDYFTSHPDIVCKSLKQFNSINRKYARILKLGAKAENNIAEVDVKINSLQTSIDTAKEKGITTESKIKKMEKQLEALKSERTELSKKTTEERLKNNWANNFRKDKMLEKNLRQREKLAQKKVEEILKRTQYIPYYVPDKNGTRC